MARNGAMPVPGPTMINGVFNGGILKDPADTLSATRYPREARARNEEHRPTRGYLERDVNWT